MESRPLVTVVVPTRNAARTVARCLAAVRAQTYPHVELVVVDNASTDETLAIAREYADRAVTRGPERCAQRNHGWRIGSGEFVVFLDADMVPTPGVVAEAVKALRGDPGLGALVIPETAFGVGFLARCRELEKRLYLGDPRVEAARVFPRAVLEQVGGYNEDLTAFEDWELADRVRAAGYRTGRTTSVVMHDEGRIRLRDAFAKKRYYGRWLSTYRGTTSRPLGRPALLSQPGQIIRVPHRFAGLVVLKTAEWSGLALGAYQSRRVTRP